MWIKLFLYMDSSKDIWRFNHKINFYLTGTKLRVVGF